MKGNCNQMQKCKFHWRVLSTISQHRSIIGALPELMMTLFIEAYMNMLDSTHNVFRQWIMNQWTTSNTLTRWNPRSFQSFVSPGHECIRARNWAGCTANIAEDGCLPLTYLSVSCRIKLLGIHPDHVRANLGNTYSSCFTVVNSTSR